MRMTHEPAVGGKSYCREVGRLRIGRWKRTASGGESYSCFVFSTHLMLIVSSSSSTGL